MRFRHFRSFSEYANWLTSLPRRQPVARPADDDGKRAGYVTDPSTRVLGDDGVDLIYGDLTHIGFKDDDTSLCKKVQGAEKFKALKPGGPVCSQCVQVMLRIWNDR